MLILGVDPGLSPPVDVTGTMTDFRVGLARGQAPQTITRFLSSSFVEPIRRARGVFFPGGRQWRLVDSYLNTRVQRELEGVLERGDFIAGGFVEGQVGHLREIQ